MALSVGFQVINSGGRFREIHIVNIASQARPASARYRQRV